MNLWHHISRERISEDSFIAVVEISKGSKNKYELDKETGRLILDRILHTSTHYPDNYGFIPLTYAEDLDPLDVLVISTESIIPLTLVKCRPIGVLHMIDGGYLDEKIIAVPVNDPFYSCYNDVKELPEHIFNEIHHFFEVYKTLEGKYTAVYHVDGRDEAKRIIKKALESYEVNILPTLK
jgi:inorganic pyrophosphatase